jgi:hypothetical protein
MEKQWYIVVSVRLFLKLGFSKMWILTTKARA